MEHEIMGPPPPYQEQQPEEELNRLSPELIARAEIEVNEKDEWRSRDIEALREIIRGDASLKCRLDDGFLLRFLRARRFDYDCAFQLLCDYYGLRSSNRELFVPLDKLKPIFDANLIAPALGWSVRDEAVLLLRLGKWNPDQSTFDEIIAACVHSMETLIEHEVTQINGIVLVLDLAGFGWPQLRRFGPSQSRKLMNVLDKCLPVRIKSIYVIQESTLADIVYALMRPFVGEEMSDKLHIVGSHLEPLLERVPAEVLPREFGGQQGAFDSSPWFEQLVEAEREAKKDRERYGFIDDLQDDEDGGRGEDVRCGGGRCRGSDAFGNGTDMKTLFRKSQTCNGYLFDYYNVSTSTI